MQKNELPIVSIIVPVYNVEKYLEECIDSILNQTLKNIEVICVDDGSTDRSGHMLDEYAANDERIHIIHKANAGVGAAMNDGINAAKGKYIGIVESDDYIDACMYEKLTEIADKNNLDYIKSDFWIVKGAERSKKKLYKKNKIDTNIVFSNYENMNKLMDTKAIWSGIYKLSFIREKHIDFLETPGASYQDTSFWFKVAISADRGMLIDDAFLNYRTDNENASMKSKDKIYCICEEMNECLSYIERENKDKAYFIPYFWKMKYTSYRWNLDRVSNEGKKEFIDRFRKEFCVGIQHNEVDYDLFTANDIFFLQLLMEDCESLYRCHVDEVREFSDAGALEDYEDITDEIYIYGAGVRGKKIGEEIRQKTGSNVIYIESSPEKAINGVRCISDNTLNKDTLLIIAVKHGFSRRVMYGMALSRGFSNIINYII